MVIKEKYEKNNVIIKLDLKENCSLIKNVWLKKKEVMNSNINLKLKIDCKIC